MLKTRVIPCLLLRNTGLVKTIQFANPTYVGDPINAVKIFNEKEVDELILLDITATVEKRRPAFGFLSQIASECFMPLGYGGGIQSLQDMRELFRLGVEKVVVNSSAVENPSLVKEAAQLFGSQSIVVSIDAKKNQFGEYEVWTHGARKRTDLDPVEHAVSMEAMGAGEIFLNSIDRDGTMEGYDLELIQKVTRVLKIPLIACGGASSVHDLGEAVQKGGAAAAAAGSLFVFQGPHRAVLISFPTEEELQQVFA